MKKLTILTLACSVMLVLLVGCTRRATNNINAAFPNADVMHISNMNANYVVRTADGSVYLVLNEGVFDFTDNPEDIGARRVFGPLR
tara:strand:- start:170 stop:427 length:258 start_codon:yes stop_codon:yes gene_type:complete